jgi:hypothetical protein
MCFAVPWCSRLELNSPRAIAPISPFAQRHELVRFEPMILMTSRTAQRASARPTALPEKMQPPRKVPSSAL